MDAEMYVHILEKALLPSAQKLYPGTNYLFMQDNDPKHTSRRAREFFCRQWNRVVEDPARVSRSEPYRECLAQAEGIYSQSSEA